MKWKRFSKLLPVLAFAGGLAVFFQNRFWETEKVDCFQDSQPCSFEVWSGCFSQLKGKNWLFASPSDLSAKLKKDNPVAASIIVRRKFPKTLVVEVVSRQPGLIVATPQGRYLSDKEGVVLGVADTELFLPVFTSFSDEKLSPGDSARDPLTLFAAELVTECQYRLLRPYKAKVFGRWSVEVTFKEGFTAVFSSHRDLVFQLDSLQFILNRTKIEGKLPERVDLRFDKPVIVNDDH